MELDAAGLSAMVLATGALGTAAFGIVDGAKFFGPVGRAGLGKLRSALGAAMLGAIENAYGPDAASYLGALYLKDRTKGDLGRTLRQGLRVGLTPENAADLAAQVGGVDAEQLAAAARKILAGEALSDAERGVVGRFELAADARIDAALALADWRYVSSMRLAASLVALLLALTAAWTLPGGLEANLARALIVGAAAVPLAPIAKDVASALQQARSAVGRRA